MRRLNVVYVGEFVEAFEPVHKFGSGMEEPEEVLVAIEEALPGMQIVSLPTGESWVGALILVKLGGEAGFSWSVRRTEGLSDEELLGQAVVLVEMLRDNIRFRK